jgi:predicted acylesterase/phospholipase RssA
MRTVLSSFLLLVTLAIIPAYQPRKPPPNRPAIHQNYKYGEGSDRDLNILSQRRAVEWGVLGRTTGSIPSRQRYIHPFVSNVTELRKAVLDDKVPFSHIEIKSQLDAALEDQVGTSFLQNHAVLKIIKQRFDAGSKPGSRTDNATVALAIEGGGMRGCVSAGMAAAIASLGLSDTFDKIYGSSAGSVVGSYAISRQMCVDVYVDILPAAKRLFVCKQRIVRGVAASFVEVVRKALGLESKAESSTSRKQVPGMNISFVLDSIMGQDHGVRPLDLEKFEKNNAQQQLRIVSSSIDEEGRLVSRCFGTEDFFGEYMVKRADGIREGLFACLEASMTVPAATGPPVEILRHKTSNPLDQNKNSSLPFFDAFCFEPLPYRSAVEEGATHVLVLASRPLGFQPATQPGVYERTLSPIYFYSHGQPKVARFFERGGQQYIYAEDILLLREAKKMLQDPIAVPPPKIMYGLDDGSHPLVENLIREREEVWKKAHLLPVQVPPEKKELGTLEQDKDAVLEAVRGGFSVAFDMLAPIVGLQDISGEEASKLVFPNFDGGPVEEFVEDLDELILKTKVTVPGDSILDDSAGYGTFSDHPLSSSSHHTLLSALPGFKGGKLYHLSKGLRFGRSSLYANHDLSKSDMKK